MIKNFISNNKRVLIIGVVIVVLAIWIIGLIIGKNETSEVILTPSPVSTTTPKPLNIPESPKINVSGIEVNNFYKEAIIIGGDGYALFDKTDKFKIAYIPVDKSFLISILDNPFEDVKKEAEKAFLQKLGITQEEACLLNVNIATNIRINPSYAGKNYKLSFCE
ncbi:hypothetical protein A2W13_01190 [Candidatus Woesebacteria bacterium RBG_16_36_11]|uniref:Uncharacterized protein n=3 Tax=Candidatus Woeseibacteriota TaxID=1752722 RepID=A0A1F7XB51_9BACT|nr:MAG: hypothetical protein A2Z67_03195 [Candidatus Woesebacteria bacterium RBG_13_36_22]OGM12241.1 MAG: hypothetical protein A2W13_01190 [Candidatus Woesebacteria bacterium RBG_16_36_11]OGM16160.1 MAG: hypothetical protein A2V55_01330 [Candidatus Woesebacteria bacterium RBG_19FT_COMBO_37_29]